MSNPYHDSEGRFCSKGEMLAEIKTLAQNPAKFNAYFQLRKSYDEIIKQQSLTMKERIDEELDNPTRLRMDTPENALKSYELVKDRLNSEVNDDYVSQLLTSENLPSEIRTEIIKNPLVNGWGIYKAVERDFGDTEVFSDKDYKNIMKRMHGPEFIAPLIAKNHTIPFVKRVEYLEGSTWGLSLLAIHNPKKFFADEDLTAKLRTRVGEEDDENNSVLSALAHSPHEEDHLTVINNPRLNEGYPSAAGDLARNRSLSLPVAHKLLSKEMSIGTSLSYAVSSALEDTHRDEFAKYSKKVKIDYSGLSVSNHEYNVINAEIKELQNKQPASFSEEEYRLDYLRGRVAADNNDYDEAAATFKKLDRKKRLTRGDAQEKLNLHNRLTQAKRVREPIRIRAIIEEILEGR